MPKTLPHKITLILGAIIYCVVLISAAGCSINQKKRGIIFRGDWAFEINRTPWVGHPGNADLPGSENGSDKGSGQRKFLCTRDKKFSLGDSLLGPLTSFKSKCRCKDCVAARGDNKIMAGYNPAMANPFPNPMTGAYPGAIQQGSLSLLPGAIVVPAGVLMPNGALLPLHLFYHQPNAVGTVNTGNTGIMTNINDNTNINLLGQPIQQFPSSLRQQSTVPQGQIQSQIPPQTLPQAEQQGSPSPIQTPQGIPVQPPILQLQMPTLAPPLDGISMSQGAMPQGMPQFVTPEVQNAMAQNTMIKNSMIQNLNTANPMMINPVYSQAVPGLSMTGTQTPGYPPIGYAPLGYSPGNVQQISTPPITGPLGAGASQQQSLATIGNSQGKAPGASTVEDDEEPVTPSHVVAMPYPRHFPVPTRPAYQRNMGMAPNYAALQAPTASPLMAQPPAFQGMTSQGVVMLQKQISQVAAMQEQQMLLERQRQALLMQQNTAVAQTASRQANRPAILRRAPEIVEIAEYDENIAPSPPTSKILLANHQTSILQPPPPRISQVANTNAAPTTRKPR